MLLYTGRLWPANSAGAVHRDRARCTEAGTGPGDRALEAAALADKAKMAGNTP